MNEADVHVALTREQRYLEQPQRGKGKRQGRGWGQRRRREKNKLKKWIQALLLFSCFIDLICFQLLGSFRRWGLSLFPFEVVVLKKRGVEKVFIINRHHDYESRGGISYRGPEHSSQLHEGAVNYRGLGANCNPNWPLKWGAAARRLPPPVGQGRDPEGRKENNEGVGTSHKQVITGS